MSFVFQAAAKVSFDRDCTFWFLFLAEHIQKKAAAKKVLKSDHLMFLLF